MYLILTLGILSLLLSLILTPLVRDVVGRRGFLDHPDGVRKTHRTPVPRVGGIAIVLAYSATFAIAFFLPFSYTYLLHKALPTILQLTLVASVVFLTGVLDDLVGLNAWQKLAGLASAASLAYFAGIRVEFHFLHALPAWPGLAFAVTVIWLVGCANAFNLIDGMDGLAAGVGLLSTVTILIAALTQGNLPLTLATLPLAGALLGFLRYNFNPASIFLGDSGSLLIGFLLGCFGALWSEKSVTLVALCVPLLAVSVPLLDVVLSILRRYLRNRPIFQADRGHIHHKLLERGLRPQAAVLTIYAICGGAAVLSLLVSATHNQFSGLIVMVFCGAAWVGIRCLEYTEFKIAGRLFLNGRFRRIIDSETRLLHFEKSLAEASDPGECWTRIREGTNEFGFHAIRMNLRGISFENAPSASTSQVFQLRIALPGEQYVDLCGGPNGLASPLILGGLVQAVEHGVKNCLERRMEISTTRTDGEDITVHKKLVYAAAGGKH